MCQGFYNMHIAILGAGFAGLSTAFHLLQYGAMQVTVFDPKGIGGEASGLKAALLHPFAGPHSKLNPEGMEGFAATKALLQQAESYVGQVTKHTGILRPLLTAQSHEKLAKAAKDYPADINWLHEAAVQEMVPSMPYVPAIYIKSGLTIYAKKYLQGLWLACQERGAKLEMQAIHSLAALKDFDGIVVAIGGGYKSLIEVSSLPFSLIKGQQLELEWPEALKPLPTVLNAQLYCLMHEDQKSCTVGSTFERDFKHASADVAYAKAEILAKLKELYPPLVHARILHCHAAVRVSAPGRRPWLQKAGTNCWVFSGLGSKGLLYHALYGKRLADMIYQDLHA